MQTGYTSRIFEKGLTAEQFIKECSRAFGAMIHMRDDSLDAEFTFPEPSPYCRDEIAKSRARIAELDAPDFWEKEKELIRAELHRYEDRLEESCFNARKLRGMTDRISGMEFPASHKELKSFCLQQLSITSFDGDIEFSQQEIKRLDALLRGGAAPYIEKVKAEEEDRIRYLTEEDTKERNRINERIEWIKELDRMLKGEGNDKVKG